MSSSTSGETALEAIDIRKSFGGVRALDGVSFALSRGEIHALVGENGAGKSTLIKVITGALRPDSGQLRLRGEVLHENSPSKAKSLGIAAIYQQPALFPHLTVAENIDFAVNPAALWKRVNWQARRERAGRMLERVGAHIQLDRLAGDLSMPEQQLVEIAKALDTNPSVLILDEPTASLGDRDAQHLFALLEQMRTSGVAIVYISHRFEELFRLSDRMTVLRDGRSVETRNKEDLTNHDLIRLMIGRELKTVFPPRTTSIGTPAFEVCDLNCRSKGIRNFALKIRAGEIVGMAGLVGSGRTEVAELIFGISTKDSGEIHLQGQKVNIKSPIDAVANGLAYLPEDRRSHGVILPMSIAENASLANLNRFSTNRFLDFKQERESAEGFVASLRIKAPDIDTSVANLSGGNQQKVALARWLVTAPRVLILDEPTQGIDVGAKSEIYQIVRDLAGQGTAILLISSDMHEVLGLSDRILVMTNGSVAGVLSRDEATPHRILELSLGQAAAVSSGPLQ
jgi:rhamnose transport system ATP-binding protein